MRKKIIWVALLSMMVLVSGCKKSAKMESAGSNVSYSKDSAVDYAYNDVSKSKENLAVTPTSAGKTESTVIKKVIQTGEARIVVEDLKKTALSIRNKVEELEGYIESETYNEYNSTARARIPADRLTKFTEFLDSSFQVESSNSSNQNVTDAYVDNDARLRNLRAQETQVLEIMKKANTIEEILRVQNELSKVRGEIEVLDARKRNWDRDVNFSTITVHARQKQYAMESKLRVLSGSEFGKAISKGFTGSLLGITLFFQNFLIFFLSNIIQLIILGLIGFFVYKKFIKGKIKL